VQNIVYYQNGTLTLRSKSFSNRLSPKLFRRLDSIMEPELNNRSSGSTVFTARFYSSAVLHLETSNFVHGSAMRSLSLAMSECFLSGRGHGHVSNFQIVDLENFATASRRYTGDIHNSTVVGLFMIPKPIGQRKRLDRVMVECTCLLHIGPL